MSFVPGRLRLTVCQLQVEVDGGFRKLVLLNLRRFVLWSFVWCQCYKTFLAVKADLLYTHKHQISRHYNYNIIFNIFIKFAGARKCDSMCCIVACVNTTLLMLRTNKLVCLWRHDTRHNDTQPKGLICDTEHK